MADNFLKEVALVPNNTYNYSNSTVFYSLVNYAFKNYYQTVIQKSQQWLDGYDPSFHRGNKGIFSTRIGAKVTAGCVKQIFGRGLIFVKGNNTTGTEGLDFISHKWQDKVNFQNVVRTIIGYTLPLGTSLAKLNTKWIKGKQELWVQALRQDYFYFSVDSENNLTDVTCFIRAFQTTGQENENYCLVEKRYYLEEYKKFTKEINGEQYEFEDKEQGKVKTPYAVYKIFKINSTSNNNTLAANTGSSINYKSLPNEIKEMLRKEYGALVLDKEIRLPFNETLGCYLFMNEGGDFTHPSMPFGRPLIFDCLTDFMEYDLERSYAMRDLYNSKGIVGIPKALNQSNFVPGNAPVEGAASVNSATVFEQLDIPGYELVEGLNPDTQKPVINQFEMRAQEHETKQNAILKSIATTIGMSPRVIASYLVQGNEKTAEQTHSEDDTITEWVKSHRQDYIYRLNEMIEDVLSFYGIIDNVEVKFASDGLVNTERQLENIGKKLELGLIDLEDAVREVYPDLDEVQINEKIAKAKQQKAENEQAQQKQFDEMYGDELDGNEDQFNQ